MQTIGKKHAYAIELLRKHKTYSLAITPTLESLADDLQKLLIALEDIEGNGDEEHAAYMQEHMRLTTAIQHALRRLQHFLPNYLGHSS